MELKDLYRDVILDHNKRPRNFRVLERPSHHAEGFNPLCGDRLALFINVEGDRIADVAFQGSGCAISSMTRVGSPPSNRDSTDCRGSRFVRAVSSNGDDAFGSKRRGHGETVCAGRGQRVPGSSEMRESCLAHAESRARP